MAHEPGGGREISGCERPERGCNREWLVRYRQGRSRCEGRDVLGFCRHTPRLGRVGDTSECGQDFLTAGSSTERRAPTARLFRCGSSEALFTFAARPSRALQKKKIKYNH